MNITRETAVRVLEVVDAGLVSGIGSPIPGQMCVEAAVCYALGLPHSDNPNCVARSLRSLKISLNDLDWSSPEARAKGLRRLALAQLGSKGELEEMEFVRRVTDLAIRKYVSMALRAVASVQDHHSAAIETVALRCETEGTGDAAYAAYKAVRDIVRNATYTAAWDALNAAAAAWDAATYAESYASSFTTRFATYATNHAARVVAHTAHAVSRAEKIDRVSILSEFAEDVVQILIAMNAPGTAWLDLT